MAGPTEHRSQPGSKPSTLHAILPIAKPMTLSDRAQTYVSTLIRDKDWTISDPQEIADYLSRQTIPAFEGVIEFQKYYSGLQLTVTSKPGQAFKASLFSNADFVANKQITYNIINGQYYFDCGDHETAQFWFVVRQDGKIGTRDNAANATNIIHSSFDKFIETYSLNDLLSRKKVYEYPAFFEVKNEELFNLLTADFHADKAASDEYNKWLFNDDLTIHQGTWYDRPSAYIHVSGLDKGQCNDFVNLLIDKQIVST